MSNITSITISKWSTHSSGAAIVRVSERVSSTVVLTDEQIEKILTYTLNLISPDVSEEMRQAADKVAPATLPAPSASTGFTDAEFEEIANEDTTGDLPF